MVVFPAAACRAGRWRIRQQVTANDCVELGACIGGQTAGFDELRAALRLDALRGGRMYIFSPDGTAVSFTYGEDVPRGSVRWRATMIQSA